MGLRCFLAGGGERWVEDDKHREVLRGKRFRNDQSLRENEGGKTDGLERIER